MILNIFYTILYAQALRRILMQQLPDKLPAHARQWQLLLGRELELLIRNIFEKNLPKKSRKLN